MVDILLATYNGDRFLHPLLQSVMHQTYPDWRIVAHDDGSADGTAAILDEYAARYPSKVVVLRDSVRFGSACRNFFHLLQQATADYIMFCDQDDVWLPEKIETTLRRMHDLEREYATGPLLVFSDLTIVNEETKVMHASMWAYQNIDLRAVTFCSLMNENVVTGCTMMINKRTLDYILPAPEAVIMHDWWVALVIWLTGHYAAIEEPLVLYRHHSSNQIGPKSYTLLHTFRRCMATPVGTLRRLHRLYSRMVEQLRALQTRRRELHIENANTTLLDAYLRHSDRFVRRKTFQVRQGMLSGNLVKKVGKLVFY